VRGAAPVGRLTDDAEALAVACRDVALSRGRCQWRFEFLFPRDAFDPALRSPIAAASVAAMLYVDAVVPDEGDLPADA